MRIVALCCAVFLIFGQAFGADALVVHEWGTFTSLQDEKGQTIGGINTDDEPVPPFVHNLVKSWLSGDQATAALSQLSQGYPKAAAPVTMRLETPVLYVYTTWRKQTLDITADFHGGWLTQFYPKADALGPPGGAIALNADTRGILNWHVDAGGDAKNIPQTDAHVWLAPRKPNSSVLTEPGGESEKYLFYRGVGHVDAPLSVSRSGDQLGVVNRCSSAIPTIWYCQFQQDGACAWRRLNAIKPNDSARDSATFTSDEFAAQNVISLRNDMQEALVKAGLTSDEAQAMLETWELSYFKSWGTRVFYIAPRAWVDSVLSLRVTPQPNELQRVMMGRIDLVTAQHRALLDKIAKASDVTAEDAELMKAYDQLGRFRNALLLDELNQRPSNALQHFIVAHGLQNSVQ